MFLRMCRGHLDSESGFAFGDDGVAEADDEDVVVEELFGHGDGSFGGADDDGADGCWGVEDFEIGFGFDLLAAVGGDVAEFLDTLGFVHEGLDRGVCTGGDGDGEGVAKEGWSASLDDEVDELLACGDEAAGAASESFAECAGEDVDGSVVWGVWAWSEDPLRLLRRHLPRRGGGGARGAHAVVFVGASAGFSEDAVGVGVVDDEEGVVLVAEFSQFRKICNVAFHGEDAVGDEPDLACDFGVVFGFFEDFTGRVHVGVFVDSFFDALLDDGGESHRVDDAGVVEFVGDDDVAGFADGGEECFGRVPAAYEGVRGFGAHVGGDRLFEGVVGGEGATNEADRGGAGAVGTQCLDAGFDDGGVVGESKVVVGAHADAFMAGAVFVDHGDGCVHGGVEGLENLCLPCGGEGIEGFFGADGEGGSGGRGHG